MIQIQQSNLNLLAKNHYVELKNKISFDAIQNTQKYTKELKYQEFVNYLKLNLESIITAKPKQLRKHIKDIENFGINLKKYRKNATLSSDQQEENHFINALRNIFDYDKKIEKPEFAKNLNLSVCPYCNREYIFKFKDNQQNGMRTLAVLDHYYDKSTYPFLALSFFNLIPSCSTCNSKFKTTKNFFETPHIHPHENSFNKKAKFYLKINDCTFYYSSDGFTLDLLPNDKHDKATENTISTFRLNELYTYHKDIVLELIQKAEIYNDSYIDELMQKYEGTLFKNREDLIRLITCGYITDEEINKRPLSKLIKDISEELELI